MNTIECNLKRNNNKLTMTFNKEIKEGELFYKNFLADSYKKLLNFKNSSEIEFEDPKPNNRTFYLIKSSEYKDLLIAERVLPLKNFSNFRDIGGYKTKDNRYVKYGIFYRSEDLNNLKDTDLNYFETLGIKTVFDYRSEEERNLNPDVKVDNITYYDISGIPTKDSNLDMMASMKAALMNKNAKNPKDLLIEGYKSMPLNNPAYKKLIETIKDSNNTPLLQHCTAGKDRTGFGSALILLLLGVDKETVIKDYLLTNQCQKNSFNELSKKFKSSEIDLKLDDDKIALIKSLLGVNTEFLNSSFDVILNKYKDFDSYFKGEFNLTSKDITNIRNMYLN